MASFLIYLPNCKGCNPASIDAYGLAELRADRSPDFAECHHWGMGSLIYWPPKTGAGPSLDVAHYDWKELGKYSLGTPKGMLPSPDLFQRDNLRSGYWVTLADVQMWCIPAAANLPHRHGIDGDGKHVREVAAQFKDYWEQSNQYALQMFQALDQIEALPEKMRTVEQTVEFSIADTWNFACRALSINYRLTPEMISHLGLIDDDAMANIAKAAIDLPVLIDCKKKEEKATLGIPVSLLG